MSFYHCSHSVGIMSIRKEAETPGLLSRYTTGRFVQTISMCKGPTTAGRGLTVKSVGHAGITGKAGVSGWKTTEKTRIKLT